MSKEQQRKKFQHKQKQPKEVPAEQRVKNLLSSLGQSPDATSALKKAFEKTIKG